MERLHTGEEEHVNRQGERFDSPYEQLIVQEHTDLRGGLGRGGVRLEESNLHRGILLLANRSTGHPAAGEERPLFRTQIAHDSNYHTVEDSITVQNSEG